MPGAGLAGLAALAALGGCGSVTALFWESYRLRATTRIIETDYGRTHEPRLRETVSGGVLLQSLNGELIWATSDGNRSVLARTGWHGLLLPDWPRTEVVYDEDAVAWVLVEEAARASQPTPYAVWSGDPRRGFELRSRFTHEGSWVELVRRGSGVALTAWNKGYAALPALGRSPVWDGRSLEALELSGTSRIRRSFFDAGATAALSDDSRHLTYRRADGRARTWTLPGLAMPESRGVGFEMILQGKDQGFLVRVYSGKHGWGIARCYADGSVKADWFGERKDPDALTLKAIPGGGYWSYDSERRSVRLISADGELSSPLPVSRLPGEDRWIEPLRYDGSRLWLAADGVLLEVEVPSGSVLKSIPLPERRRSRYHGEHHYQIRVAPEGFFVHSGNELSFFALDGRRRRLGS